MAAVSHGNEICNRWGLDTISTGVSIAFAMECTERGILSRDDTDGIDLCFGNADGMVQMIRKIAFREGFGALLAKGVKVASREIGKESEPYALHVKGQEMAVHEPRGKFGVALSFALSPTGADHVEAPHDTSFTADNGIFEGIKPLGEIEPLPATELGPRKVSQFAHTQQVFSLYNSLGVCNFAAVPYSAYTFSMMTALVEAVTGWNTSLFELLEVGERGVTMARMFNVREGIMPTEDGLPDRFFHPLRKGAPDEKRLDRDAFGKNIRLYYQAMGWDPETAVPTDGRLAYLRLEWLMDSGRD